MINRAVFSEGAVGIEVVCEACPVDVVAGALFS